MLNLHLRLVYIGFDICNLSLESETLISRAFDSNIKIAETH